MFSMINQPRTWSLVSVINMENKSKNAYYLHDPQAYIFTVLELLAERLFMQDCAL